MEICYAVSVCLSAGASLVVPLPWPVAQNHLKVITINIIIIIMTRVGIPFRPIDLLRILGHLKLEGSSKPNRLLVLRNG